MRIFVPTLALSLLLTACVDTTGLSKESSKPNKGNPSAIVTVEEYADLQCPACKAAHEQLVPQLLELYGNSIVYVFKHMPLRTIHPYAMEAAMASECAADQGKFWEFVDMDYANQSALNSSSIREWGSVLGLDADLFDRCIRSNIKQDTVLADMNEGLERGVTGTPTFYVNGQRVSSTIEELGAAIQAALNNASSIPL